MCVCMCTWHLPLSYPFLLMHSPILLAPSVIRVDCITVSTLPIKASVEDHIQQLFDALLTSLQRSIQANLSAIDQFLVKGKEALSIRPQTIEEIGDVNQAHTQLAREKPSVSSVHTLCQSCVVWSVSSAAVVSPLAGRNSPLYVYTFKAVFQCGPVVVKWCILRIGLDVWSSFPVVSALGTHCFTFLSHLQCTDVQYWRQLFLHMLSHCHCFASIACHLFFIFLHIKRCTSSLVCTHTTNTLTHVALSSSSTFSIL